MTPAIAPDDVLVELRERLRRKSPGYVGTLGEDGRAVYAESEQMILVNPDGPEAADAITTLRERERRRDKIIAAAADAIDIADNIIAINLGTDTPKEWDRAFRRVAKARAALTREGG